MTEDLEQAPGPPPEPPHPISGPHAPNVDQCRKPLRRLRCNVHAQRPGYAMRGMALGLVVIVVGMAHLWFAAREDAAALRDAPWENAVLLFETPRNLPVLETLPVRVRRVRRDAPLRDDFRLNLLGGLLGWDRFEGTVRLTDPEWVFAADLPGHRLAPLLESGRLPVPGAPEVLAGDLARMEPFQVDGQTFQVVGRLKRSASVFLFAYLLPHGTAFAASFSPARGARTGLLVEDGSRLFEEDLLPELYSEPAATAPETASAERGTEPAGGEPPLVLPNYHGGILRSPDDVALRAMTGLFATALGGACFLFCLFLWMHAGHSVLARPFLGEVRRRSSLFLEMHLFFYGVFFFTMWFALENPLLAYRLKLYIEMAFSQGGVGHVGAAYDSGSIAQAAWMTFYNNYIEQTLLLTFLISLVPIPLGLVKNLLSFLLIGGAMAPIWSGSAAMFMVHVFTMVLELEAYILACFAITAWPLTLFTGIWSRRLLDSLKRGVLMLLSAMVVTGVLLAAAALYEALTLIHLL